MSDSGGGGLGGVDSSDIITVVAVGIMADVYETGKKLEQDREDDPAVWERRWKVAKPVLGTVAAAFILFMLLFVSRA